MEIGETREINERVNVTRQEPEKGLRSQYAVNVDDDLRAYIVMDRHAGRPWELRTVREDDQGVGSGVGQEISSKGRHGIQKVADPIKDLAIHAMEMIDHPHKHELETPKERKDRIAAAKERDRIDRVPEEERRQERIQVINRLRGILHNPNLTDQQKGALQGAITALEKALQDLSR